MFRTYVDSWGLLSDEPNLDAHTRAQQKAYVAHIARRITVILDSAPVDKPAIVYLQTIIAQDLKIHLQSVEQALLNFQGCPPGMTFTLGPFLCENRRWVAGLEQSREILSRGYETYMRAYKEGNLILLGKA
jgi:hypothetical protein